MELKDNVNKLEEKIEDNGKREREGKNAKVADGRITKQTEEI